MSTTSPTTALRAVLIAVLNAEFNPEEVVFADDKLHESMGSKGAVGAVYPNYEEQMFNNADVTTPFVTVQYYDRYNLQIDPAQSVDPTIIETKAERFKRALQGANPGGSAVQWYPLIIRIDFPDDPTGNKTRFEATVRGHAQNTALIETTG